MTSTLNVDLAGDPINQMFEGKLVGPSYSTVTLGAGGLGVGIAGGTVVAVDSPTVSTSVGSATTVNATGNVSVRSETYQLAQANGLSIAVGLGVGVGTVTTNATAGGSVTTGFLGTLESALSLSVNSDVATFSISQGRTVGGALGAAIGGPRIDSTTSTAVATNLGGTVTASGDIEVVSDVTTGSQANGWAFNVALLVAAGRVNIVASDIGTVSTTVTPNSVVTSTDGAIRIEALHNYPYVASADLEGDAVTDPRPEDAIDPAKPPVGAHAYASISGGGTISIGNTTIDAVAQVNVDTTVAATAKLRATGAGSGAGVIKVNARSANYADARVKSSTGGVIDVSIANPTATVGPTSGPPDTTSGVCAARLACTTVNMLGSVSTGATGDGVGAADLTVLAEGLGYAISRLDTRGGGLVRVTASSTATAQSRPTTRVVLGANGSKLRTSGDIKIDAVGFTDADSSAITVGGGFVNVASFSSVADAMPVIGIRLANGTVLNAGGDVTIKASQNADEVEGADGTFNAGSTQVDLDNTSPAGNSITFTLPHGVKTGDVVTYDAQFDLPGNTAGIGGITDNREYAVIVRDPQVPGGSRTLQFGALFGSGPDEVNVTNDTIRFGTYVPIKVVAPVGTAGDGLFTGTVTFVDGGTTGNDSITSTSDFFTAGFELGQSIRVTSAGVNDGDYVISGMSAQWTDSNMNEVEDPGERTGTTLILSFVAQLTAAGPVGGVTIQRTELRDDTESCPVHTRSSTPT